MDTGDPKREYTESQRQEFKEQYRQRRRRQWLATLPMLLAVAIFVWVPEHSDGTLDPTSQKVLLGLGIALLLGFVAFTLTNWRCPACGRTLGRGMIHRFCRWCGVALS